jgi:hypothetical protein
MNTNGGSISINMNELFGNFRQEMRNSPTSQNLVKQQIMMLVSQSMGMEYVPLIQIHFETLEGQNLAIVDVDKSTKPILMK